MTTPETEPTPPSVWMNRDFRLVLAGGLVNNIGDWLLALALPIYVFTTSGSGQATAAVFLIELAAGVLLGPYGGSLADRWDLRRTVIVTNMLQAITLFPLLTVSKDRLWPAFVVVAAQSLLQQVNNPASFALVPRMVPPSQLVQANAVNATSASLARLIGAPLGGIAVGLGGLGAVMWIDAASFAAVAVAIAFVRTPTASLQQGQEADRARPSVSAGWRDIRSRPALTGYLTVETLAQVAFAMFPVLFIKFVTTELNGGGAEIGIIRGVAGFGGFAASLVVTGVAKHAVPAQLMTWGYLGLGFVAALFVNGRFRSCGDGMKTLGETGCWCDTTAADSVSHNAKSIQCLARRAGTGPRGGRRASRSRTFQSLRRSPFGAHSHRLRDAISRPSCSSRPVLQLCRRWEIREWRGYSGDSNDHPSRLGVLHRVRVPAAAWLD